MKKRLLSLALALVMVLALMPTAAAMTGVKITKKGQVVDSITFKGVTVNAIYAPQSTVSNYSSDPTYCCAAFVSKFFREVYGVKVYNLVKNGGGPKVDKGSFSVTTNPQVGDVVHRKTDTSTHWAIIKAVDSKTVTLIEQNAWYSRKDDKARVGKTYDRSDSAVTFYRYHPVEEKESENTAMSTITIPVNDFSLQFDANGGSGAPPAKSMLAAGSSEHTHIIPDQHPSRPGYTFLGWATTSNATVPQYHEGDRFTVTRVETLYAVWAPNCDNGHTWSSWKTMIEASCEADGKRERVCSVCGETEEESLPATGHQWSRWQDVVKASCEVEGQRERICEFCEEVETETIAALEHNYRVDGETDEAIYYVCTNCGDSYTEEKELPAEEKGNFKNFYAQYYYSTRLFSDVKYNDWFYENVKATYEFGLMKGTGSGTFAPGNNVTAAEAITLAARIHSIYYTGSDNFARYDGGNWYDPYVDYARENNIIDTYYAYSRPATREEFVHILAKALPEEALENIAGRVSFADSEDIIFMADVRLLSGAGVINGIQENGKTYFKPFDTITRAEVAAVVARMVKPSQRVGN